MVAFNPSRRLVKAEEFGDLDDRGPVEHVGGSGVLHRLQAMPDGGGHGDRCRRLVFDVFRQAVIDQGGEEGASLLLGRIAFDDQVDAGEHPGVAQDHVDVVLERVLIGEKRRPPHGLDMIGNIRVGDAEARSRDVLGRVYEYFLSQFASAEGKKGGEFYTPRCVVKLLVEMLEPYRGRVYDPCCGSSGMFVQSIAFIRAHASGNANGGKARGDISIYGQESNYTTWRLAKMNLAIRGIGGRSPTATASMTIAIRT